MWFCLVLVAGFAGCGVCGWFCLLVGLVGCDWLCGFDWFPGICVGVLIAF